jgi:SAM-dependent methyltransferase
MGPEPSKNSKILDLACGNGQISAGLSPFIGNAFGVDFSTEMLAKAIKNEKISYIHHDINSKSIILPEVLDHFFIGRAIHWIDIAALRKIIGSYLRPGGSIVILGAGWSSETRWLRPFLEVQSRYSSKRKIDFIGKEKLKEVGFELIERLEIKARTTCSIDYLVKNSLSYNRTYSNIIVKIEEFQQAIAALAAPHQRTDGFLDATVVSWALVYRKV